MRSPLTPRTVSPDAWEQALAADRPTVLDIPLRSEGARPSRRMPPYEQIKEMTAAVLKGDPNAWH